MFGFEQNREIFFREIFPLFGNLVIDDTFNHGRNANEWSDVKARKPPTLLEGEALAVWMELSEAEKESYQLAKAEMITRMAPVRFVLLGDFHGR